MQDSQSFLPKDFYSQDLSFIRNIPFTRREVDVMACLISARKTSKIAYFLSVNPRTVETHIRNITLKLDCNTREGIIDFLEVSHKIPLLRKHYVYLQLETTFEKALKSIMKSLHANKQIFLISSKDNQEIIVPIVSLLQMHLEMAGFTIANKINKQKDGYLLYILPQSIEDIPALFVETITLFRRFFPADCSCP